MQIKSVAEVTRYIKALIDNDLALSDLWIEGEISNYKRAASGHCYFTMKDGEAEIRCVMWRNDALRMRWIPEQGNWAQAHGYVSVYERGGAYQLYVDTLEHGGVGLLWKEFLELRVRLELEGLFDAARKRSLPAWPRRIGVVTSPTGAARRDIENVLRARYPLAEMVLAASVVQGQGAPESLCSALESLEGRVDLVIVARGGGSLEDLWAFNDERVARAIAACPVPVISGVGHETDFTIADFVADVRAPTPSAAAAVAVPDQTELQAQLSDRVARLSSGSADCIARHKRALQAQERLLRLHDPRRKMAEQRQQLDDALRGVSSAWHQRLRVWSTRLDGRLNSLRALNPHLVLHRGYAVIQDSETGSHIASAKQTTAGRGLRIRMHDGSIAARVTNTAEADGVA